MLDKILKIIDFFKKIYVIIYSPFKNPIAGTKGTGMEVNLELQGNRKINYAVILEDIAKGERIRKYRIEALINGQ